MGAAQMKLLLMAWHFFLWERGTKELCTDWLNKQRWEVVGWVGGELVLAPCATGRAGGGRGGSRSLGVTLQQPNNRGITLGTLNELLKGELAVHVLVHLP